MHGPIPQVVGKAYLHPVSVFQTTHLGYSIKYGPILGLVFSSAIFGLCLFFFPPSIKIHLLGYIAILAFGFGFGICCSGLIGLGVKDKIIEKYENYVSEGHYIMMIDAADESENILSEKY